VMGAVTSDEWRVTRNGETYGCKHVQCEIPREARDDSAAGTTPKPHVTHFPVSVIGRIR